MSELVERLLSARSMPFKEAHRRLFTQAADEIERLQGRFTFEQRCHRLAIEKTERLETELAVVRKQLEKAREMLGKLVSTKALVDVRSTVAGWNGEGRKDGPYDRHPANLGARIETRCGAMYELDEIMQAARNFLTDEKGTNDAGHLGS